MKDPVLSGVAHVVKRTMKAIDRIEKSHNENMHAQLEAARLGDPKKGPLYEDGSFGTRSGKTYDPDTKSLRDPIKPRPARRKAPKDPYGGRH